MNVSKMRVGMRFASREKGRARNKKRGESKVMRVEEREIRKESEREAG